MNKFNFDFYSNDGYPKVETPIDGKEKGATEVEWTYNNGNIDATEVEWTYNTGAGDGDFFF